MKRIILQAVRFFGISGIGWLLDFCAYTALSLASKNLFLNNTVSSWLGVTFTFVFSTRAVFTNAGRIPLKAKYTLYLLYQLALILAVSQVLKIADARIARLLSQTALAKSSFIIAKILVTPLTMTLNFLAMKFLMEKMK